MDLTDYLSKVVRINPDSNMYYMEHIRSRHLVDPIQDCKLLGIVRAFTGIRDAAVIVHGRPGCHSGMVTLQALTSSQRHVNVVFSGLRSEDMTFGGERRLLKAILNTCSVLQPKLIVIAVASAAGIMGDDVEGIVVEARSRGVNVPILVFDACGYSGTEAMGYEEALERLGDIVKYQECRIPNTVNIIGFRADEPHWRGDLKELTRLLEIHGIKVNTVISWCSVEDIEKLARAELNVVLGGDGLRLAEYLKRSLDMPYVVVPYPFGIRNTVEMLETVCKALSIPVRYDVLDKEETVVRETLHDFYTYVEGVYGSASTAVLAESSRAFSLARFLQDEAGLLVDLICVRCRNALTEQEATKWNCEILVEPDRLELEEKLSSLDIDILYASSLERGIAAKLGIALVRASYPVIDEITLTDTPLAGPRGTLTLLEKTINELLRMQEKSEIAYLARRGLTKLGE